MANGATPNTTMAYTPFFPLHGREMTLPSNEELKARVTKVDPNLEQRLSNLEGRLKQAYKAVYVANK